jgi:LysM repeat protein
MAWDGELDDGQELLRAIKQSWATPRTCDQVEPIDCPAPPSGLKCDGNAESERDQDSNNKPDEGIGGSTCGTTHTIQASDTCWELWDSNGMSKQQFMQLNPGIDCGALAIGQSVCTEGSSGSRPENVPEDPNKGGCSTTHTIEAGDTCWALWDSNGMSKQQFMQLNPGIDCVALAIGQSVCTEGSSGPSTENVPEDPNKGGCSTTHIIEAGDTCWALWDSNGMSKKQFMQLNPGIDCGALDIGQSVCLRSSGSSGRRMMGII